MSLGDLALGLEEVEYDRLTEPDLAAITDFGNELARERDPRHVDITPNELLIFSHRPGKVTRRFYVWDETRRPVAHLEVSFEDDGSNPHLLRTTIGVAPAQRRKGVGSALLDLAAEIARDLERPTLSGNVFDTVPAGGAFADAIGARTVLEFHMNGVAVADLPLDLLRSWEAEGPTRAPGYSVNLIEGAYPEELLEGMAHLYHVLERDMPAPEGFQPREYTPELVAEFMEHFLQGVDLLTSVAVDEETAEVVGMSQLGRRRAAPTTWFVSTTMVDPAHRGHALGKWVKAHVTLAALDRWSGGEYIETGNAFTNEAMLAINHAMGFRHEYTMTWVEAGVGQVESYLASRSG
jgi:GNAT superfamily N-acetyltransferase